MSSILKALKKLEQEKNIRRQEVMEIDTKILLDDRPRYGTTRIALFCLVLFACGGISVYWLLNNRNIPAASAPVATAHAPVTPTEAPAVMPAAAVQPTGPGPTAPAVRTPRQPKDAAMPGKPAGVQPAPAIPAGQPEPAYQPADPPTVRVTGIAYQPEGMESVAMVNGVQVMAGSAVEGARVEEILRDRVRFSFGGRQFEVLLGRSSR